MKPKEIELHIEELILHGFAPADRYVIAEAMKQEFARLFRDGGMTPSMRDGVAIASLSAGAFNITANPKADAVGSQIARAVYGGLRR